MEVKMTVVTLQRNIFKNYLNRYFIETGTYEGDAVQKALEAGFDYCYSIELSDKYFRIATERFKDNPKVKIIQGDSALMLWDVIKDINGRITFWLDGHYSKGDTALGKYCSPLIAEIEQIGRHYNNKHTIIIDDMRNWTKPGPIKCCCSEFPCGKIYGFGYNEIMSALLKVNPIYNFEYIDGYVPNDILIAKP